MKKKNKTKCDCGDKNCKRVVKGTPEGKLYVENHFTCGKVHKQILRMNKFNRANKLKI